MTAIVALLLVAAFAAGAEASQHDTHETRLLIQKLRQLCDENRARREQHVFLSCHIFGELDAEALREDIRVHVRDVCQRIEQTCRGNPVPPYAVYSQTLGCATFGHSCQPGAVAQIDDAEYLRGVARLLFPHLPPVVNAGTKPILAQCFAEALEASQLMHLVPRPPRVPTVGWLVQEAVKAAYRRITQDRAIYQTVQRAVAYKCVTQYDIERRTGDD